MPLFKCERCGCVENTAPSNYWMRGNGPALCTECDPAIGQWHGLFPKRSADGYVDDGRGFLRRAESADTAPGAAPK